jgi:hypothetical protein
MSDASAGCIRTEARTSLQTSGVYSTKNALSFEGTRGPPRDTCRQEECAISTCWMALRYGSMASGWKATIKHFGQESFQD